MAASDVSSTNNAKLAFCRLVEETSGRETLRYFGPGCLVKFKCTKFLHSVGTPNSNYFLVASNQVLPKVLLGALEKQEKERRKKREPTVKMVAEFHEIKSEGRLQRKPLSELYRSLEDDVFELDGITYVALTKLEQRFFGKSSLLNRALEVVNTTEGNSSTVLTNQLQCFVFCSERTINREDRNVGELSTKLYDLLQVDGMLANDESRYFPSYFLRNEEKKRFLREDEFQNLDGKPLGSIILDKDCKFGGVLNFVNNNPAPAIVGISGFDTGFSTAGEKRDVTEREIHAGASGGIYPMVDPQILKHEVGTETANMTDVSTLSKQAVTPSTGNQFVAGFGDESKSEESSRDAVANNPQQIQAVNGENAQERKKPDFSNGRASSPTENSYRSHSSSHNGQDFKGIMDVVNLPPENGIKEEPPQEEPADDQRHQADDDDQSQAHAGDRLPLDQVQDRSRDSSQGQGRRSSFPPDPPNKQECLPVQRSSSVLPAGEIRKYQLSFSTAGEKHDITEREIHAGASGEIYPMLDPEMLKHEVGTEAANETDVSTLSKQAVTPSTGNQFVAGFGDESKSEESSRDAVANNPQQIQAVDGENAQERKKRDFSNGRASSPTENSYRSHSSSHNGQDFKGIMDVVNLPPENGIKEEPPQEEPADDQRHQADDDDQSQAHAGDRLPLDQVQDRSRDSSQGQGRRSSFPPDPPNKLEHLPVQRSFSVLSQPAGEIRKYQLSDPLTKTLLGSLELLEESSRCLDQEYKYGRCKCWKHIAEFFDVPEEDYQNFKCNQVQSPTEVMFEYLESVRPDITVGVLKDGLAKIDRQDVTDILLKHEKWDPSALNDGTFVSSLFDSDPDIIGEMAVFLDKQKPGLKNWSHLAAKLGVTRKTFKTFETSSPGNPTEEFFEIVKVKFPKLTVGELIGHLEAIQRRDVIIAIQESDKVTKCSVIKDLIADVDVMDNVCELLNTRKRATKVLGLKHLGRKLGIKKEILDDLLPTQEETQSPTEALIRHLGGKNPGLTLANFIWAVHLIDRPDVITVLDVYLPDGCIPNLLKSCICERCKETSLKQLKGEGQ